MKNKQQQRSRILLIVLGMLFMAPIIIGALLAYTGWRPGGDTNSYGQLLPQFIEVQPFTGESLYGKQPLVMQPNADNKKLTEKWTLVYTVGPTCNAVCKTRLNAVRAMPTRRKTVDVLQRATVVSVPPSEAFAEWLAIEHTDAPVMLAAGSNQPLVDALQAVNGLQPDTLYLISPFGEIGLYWDAEKADLKRIEKELLHLLKFKQGG